MVQVIQTTIIPNEDDIDPDVFAAMTSLGCFKDRPKLIESLLNSKHNTEKVIYFLLLDRKLRQPTYDDPEDTKQRSRSGSPDVPQKRVDRQRSTDASIRPNSSSGSYRSSMVAQLTEGSPLVSRRQLYTNIGNKTISANNTPSVSPCSSPTVVKKDVFNKINALTAKNSLETPSNPVTPSTPSTSIASNPIVPAAQIHRHHRNTSTVSQNDTILTTQPSAQSIANNILSEQSYSSVSTDVNATSSIPINNGTTSYHPTPRRAPIAPPVSSLQTSIPATSTTSESMTMDSSSSSISNNAPATPNLNNNQWRHKLNTLKQSFQNVGTPRFHRRPKVLVNENDNSTTFNSPSQYGTTPEATKKSLFHHIIDAMQEDHHMIVVKDRPLAAIKTDLIHAFLSTPDLVHNVLSGTQYRCEYRRPDRSSMFQRNIRFHVEICTVKSTDPSSVDSYYVTFTLITGQARRFKKLCEEIQTLFLTSKDRLAKQRRQTNEMTRPTIPPVSAMTNPPAAAATATSRPNASFISSLFGTNSTASYVKSFVPQQSSSSSLSSNSNISLTHSPAPVASAASAATGSTLNMEDSSTVDSLRAKLAHRLAI